MFSPLLDKNGAWDWKDGGMFFAAFHEISQMNLSRLKSTDDTLRPLSSLKLLKQFGAFYFITFSSMSEIHHLNTWQILLPGLPYCSNYWLTSLILQLRDNKKFKPFSNLDISHNYLCYVQIMLNFTVKLQSWMSQL